MQMSKIAYKKVRKMKDGTYKPLFIDKTKPFVFGQWMNSEYHPTKGFAPRSIHGDITTGEGCDGGWHCTPEPEASWIADELSNGEQRVWMVVEMEDYIEYQRPQGIWYLANKIKPIKILEV